MKKAFVNAARIIVGLLFLFSSFVKLVDPLGFSYKLQEYFGPNVFHLDFLQAYALPIAIGVIIIEFLLGLMLLLGYAQKFTRWALLLLIIFFTFLTFYSAYFDKVTDCGCFGDAIPLTPWQSFAKNILLLALIVFLFINGRYLTPIFRVRTNKWIVFFTFIGCLWMSYHVLVHLPLIDFRPYKVGTNIEAAMKTKGPELPPVHDFFIMRDGMNQTDSILHEKKVLLVCSYDMDLSDNKGWEAVKKVTDTALIKGYDVIGLTASLQKKVTVIKQQYHLNFNFSSMDETTVKTIIRANPGLLLLHRGTVVQKVSWQDADRLKFD